MGDSQGVKLGLFPLINTYKVSVFLCLKYGFLKRENITESSRECIRELFLCYWRSYDVFSYIMAFNLSMSQQVFFGLRFVFRVPCLNRLCLFKVFQGFFPSLKCCHWPVCCSFCYHWVRYYAKLVLFLCWRRGETFDG